MKFWVNILSAGVGNGTALLFAAITLRFGASAELPAYLSLAAVGVALALLDLDIRRLPDPTVLPAHGLGPHTPLPP